MQLCAVVDFLYAQYKVSLLLNGQLALTSHSHLMITKTNRRQLPRIFCLYSTYKIIYHCVVISLKSGAGSKFEPNKLYLYSLINIDTHIDWTELCRKDKKKTKIKSIGKRNAILK